MPPLRLLGDGRGSWQRQLNKNDWIALSESKTGVKLAWLLSPRTLAPRERVFNEQLAFVAPGADEAFSGGIDQKYKTSLRFTDIDTKAVTEFQLPFGKAPKTYSSHVEMLKDIAIPVDAETVKKWRDSHPR